MPNDNDFWITAKEFNEEHKDIAPRGFYVIMVDLKAFAAVREALAEIDKGE